MENKSKIKYSIIRYSPDKVRGEIINVGVILHDVEKVETKFNILDENSPKLKSILESKVDINTYKSFKDVMEYYLTNANNDLSGTVGNKCISSYYSEDFLIDLHTHFLEKNLFFSKPIFAITKDKDRFFNNIYSRYVRKDTLNKSISTISAKDHLKHKFEELNLIGKKVKTDYKISPIKKIDDYKIKVDFTFKNGLWNYIQAIPKNAASNMDWYSKLQVMSQNLDEHEAKIYLAYSENDLQEDQTVNTLINYLLQEHKNIDKLNIDNKVSLNNLCEYINDVGENFQNIAI